MSGVIRINSRSRRCCRSNSCPAANGIRCVNPSSATESPSLTTAATPSRSDSSSAIGWILDRILPRGLLHRNPAQLGELLQRGAPPEAPEAACLDAPKRHLRLVLHGRVVDMAD